MEREVVRASRIEPDDGSSGDIVMERFGRISELDRSFDHEYWQRLGDTAIYQAAWELVEFYHRDQGKEPNELRLQRTVEAFQRR